MESIDYSRCTHPERCPICFHESFVPVGSRATIHPDSHADFSVRRCTACGHWHTTPLPSQEYLNQLYSEGSLSVMGEGWEEATATRSTESSAATISPQSTSYWIFESEKGNEPGDYLEIGPGDFSLHHTFSNAGWRCFAVEPGSWARSMPSTSPTIEAIPADMKFSVVVLNDVLEHTSDPLALLKAIEPRLSAGGRIYLAFPNADSLKARLLKASWRMVRPIGHLHYFSSGSVDVLASSAGLSVAHKEARELASATPRGIYDDVVRIGYSVLTRDGARAKRLVYRLFSHFCGFVKAGDQWMVILHKQRSN